MTTRRDVDRLTSAQRELVRMARADLSSFFLSVDLRRPELVRDALLEVVPMLVREYGELAATVAAEWYESVHPGAFLARTAEGVADVAVQGAVRFAAGDLFTDSPFKTEAILSGALQRFITYSGRQTVARNVSLDPSKPRFGRVPTGAVTCAFCSLMASRGFVYLTRETAGLIDDYHDDCDCQIVSQWDADEHHIEGYDPDHLYGLYLSAREASGSEDPKTILSQMRDMFPDQFTDGHTH